MARMATDPLSAEGLHQLARSLWAARRDGYAIDRSQFQLPATTEEAYAVQHEIIALSGYEPCGYKVGSTSKEAQAHLGTSGPGAGVLLRPFLYETPAKVCVPAEHAPAVEGEFAFLIGKPLPTRELPYTLAEVSSAIDCVAGSIEIVGSRFVGGLGGQGRLATTADCSANIGLVIGRWHAWRDQDLREHQVAMSLDGAPQGSGTGERALGSPLNVLFWLATHLSSSGQGLSAGDVVATGTCTGLDRVGSARIASADFGALGTIEVTFEAG